MNHWTTATTTTAVAAVAAACIVCAILASGRDSFNPFGPQWSRRDPDELRRTVFA